MNFRDTIAQAIADYLRDLGDGGISPGRMADAVLTLLADPGLREAILTGPMNLQVDHREISTPWHSETVLVVRPRGEQVGVFALPEENTE